MHVPDHIYLTGISPKKKNEPTNKAGEALAVPERITLAADGSHVGMKTGPAKDLIRNKIDSISVKEFTDFPVPAVITAAQMPSPDVPEINTESVNRVYLRTDEREMRLLGRQIRGLSVRVTELEQSFARSQSRELGLWALVGASIVTIVLMVLRNYKK